MSLLTSAATEAFIALGSNLGDSRRILEQAFVRLQELSAAPVRRSSLWRSSPVGCPPGSPDFFNAVAAIVPLPGETPESLLGKLRSIERELGRTPKTVPNEPRTLDLDLIMFGNEVRSTVELILPHPRAHLRRFVLEPLRELAPALVLPGLASSISQLANELQNGEVLSRL
jgi:2-amino-4-hydroxy-6-hydroxymethyldihydropteridine diphosphokinase